MPEAVRSRWVGAWNGAHDNCRRNGTGGPDCEGYAFRVANAAIKEVGGMNDDKAAHGNEGLMRRAMRAMQSAMGAMRSMMGDDGEHEEMASSPAARAVTIAKDSKGSWRWLAVVSNQFRDRDGEIITEKAHQDFARAVAEGEAPHPELWLWHIPGTRVGKSDLVAYSDGFLLASGTFDSAATAERLSGIEADLGVSHGFNKQQTGTDITAYRTFEISLLPHAWAANPWTAVDLNKKEYDMAFTEDQRAFLTQALGEEKTKEIEATLPAASDKLKAAGVDYKGIDTAQIVEAVTAAIDMKGLSELLKGIDERTQSLSAAHEESSKGLKDLLARIEKLEQSDDAKVAAALAPRSHDQLIWKGYRASQSAENKVDEKEAESVAPKANWLGEVLANAYNGARVS